MAAVVYGGSPRHHSRMANTHHLHHSNTLQQTHHHYISPAVNPSSAAASLQFNSHQTPPPSAGILMPPASYLSPGAPIPTSQQPQSYPQSQQQQQFQFQQHQTVPQSHYHHSSIVYASQRHHSKRKSAVELLAESKPFYVKSETVLDRHQQLNFRSGGPNPVTKMLMMLEHKEKLSDNFSDRRNPHTGGGGGNHRPANRRSASSSSDLLQTKLRKLLNADAKDSIPEVPSRYKGEPQKYDTFSKYQTVKYSQELSVHPGNDQSDVSVMFPSAFLSPQSLPPHPASDDDIYSYGIDEPLVLTEDYRAISPPAEYAAANSSPEKEPSIRCSYQRSYSHSHEAASDDPDYSSPSYNINSHKSLPDLHSQISRHSPHSEVLSCCSRGNRSNKSGGGSSLNRDSGGSSGHYTHRSEPCCKQKDPNKMCINSDFRRDSGSSTQHSGNSYYTYGVTATRYDCPECRAKYQKDSECLLNFTTPEVPEAFQDDYPETNKATVIRYYEDSKMNSNRFIYSPKQQQHQHQQQQHQQQPSPTSKTSEGGPHIKEKKQDLSPPLGTFKRQKCLRFKHRNRHSSSNDRNSTREMEDDDRKPILRSKSDISDRYWNRSSSSADGGSSATSCKSTCGLEKRGKSESLSQLEKFFDRLGLNDEKYEEIYDPKRRYNSDNDSDQSSTVFFSDVSTVDSTRLPDSTETSQNSQNYRPSEPPSIVERNARIIKWLCNCRKLQLT